MSKRYLSEYTRRVIILLSSCCETRNTCRRKKCKR